MKAIVRSNDDVFTVDAEDVNDLKAGIEDREFIPSELQRLQIGSRVVEAGMLLGQVEEDDEVELILDLNGGMRAKWRKKRMRRLRRIRRKRRQRAK